MLKLPNVARRSAKTAIVAVALGGAILATAPLASASYVGGTSKGWELVGNYTPNSYVGGTPSYNGTAGLLLNLSARTGMSCWSTNWYLATDGRYYNYQCF